MPKRPIDPRSPPQSYFDDEEDLARHGLSGEPEAAARASIVALAMSRHAEPEPAIPRLLADPVGRAAMASVRAALGSADESWFELMLAAPRDEHAFDAARALRRCAMIEPMGMGLSEDDADALAAKAFVDATLRRLARADEKTVDAWAMRLSARAGGDGGLWMDSFGLAREVCLGSLASLHFMRAARRPWSPSMNEFSGFLRPEGEPYETSWGAPPPWRQLGAPIGAQMAWCFHQISRHLMLRHGLGFGIESLGRLSGRDVEVLEAMGREALARPTVARVGSRLPEARARLVSLLEARAIASEISEAAGSVAKPGEGAPAARARSL